ncbi:MAG TPA: type I methionyl aminopeptidase [Candidatus Caccosoma faecigallinarum]|mgnify:FL=1|uniref:Methionine aminopeptidase n=1 Tax=Candidatus Caccosoma faecigallinarum TaxID=2840720 RepID=A0A9D1KB14_9FIRM|nr:methionine aminopeptidase [Firmicutes bacterium CAG:631]HIT16931.1 type I methionyl aminopeptidase [Candidatus Caccosoma faecigallinarum]
MIIRKTPREIALLKEAGRIVALVHQELKKSIVSGITTKEIDKLSEKIIRQYGATPSFKGYQGFPGAVCVSINDMVIHGIPGHQKLKNGDIVSVDVGACYQGYHGDSAWTYAVGEVSDEAKRLMKVTEEALYEGLKQAKPGNHVGDISAAIENYVRKNGYTSPEDYTGHGVGTSIHEDPMVPNYGKYGHGPLLKPGMVIAVEPMVHAGKKEVKVLKDGWGVVTADHSLAAHYEHTIVITEDGYEILTKL